MWNQLRAVRWPTRLLAGGVSAAALGVTHGAGVTHARNASSDSELNQLWGSAMDGMIDVPGSDGLAAANGVLYLSPMGDRPALPASVSWPKVIAKSVVFSLTASNPMGAAAPAAWNSEANAALERDIASLRTPPRAWWRSFGFHAGEGWREDGFSLAFALEERMFARGAMLKLAHKYRQAAIYAYHVDAQGLLVREVLWVDRAKQVELGGTREYMQLLAPAPPQTPLAAREWSRPTDDDAAQPPPPAMSTTGRPKSIWSLRWN